MLSMGSFGGIDGNGGSRFGSVFGFIWVVLFWPLKPKEIIVTKKINVEIRFIIDLISICVKINHISQVQILILLGLSFW